MPTKRAYSRVPFSILQYNLSHNFLFHRLFVEIKAYDKHSHAETGYSDGHLPMHSDFSFTDTIPVVNLFLFNFSVAKSQFNM